MILRTLLLKWFIICSKPLSQSEWRLQKRHLQIDRGYSAHLPKKMEMLLYMVDSFSSSNAVIYSDYQAPHKKDCEMKLEKSSKRKCLCV